MNKTLKTILILSLLSIFLIAAAPSSTDLVRLTIKNNSNDMVTLRLDGPQFYYLTVRPGEMGVFTPRRGEYTAKLYSCGVFVDQELNLKRHQKIVVPACGTKAFTGNSDAIDAGQIIKLVRVKFTNEADNSLVIILKGPSEYVFLVRSGETKTYTIPKGEYKVKQYGCPVVKEFTYYAYANKTTDLFCGSY